MARRPLTLVAAVATALIGLVAPANPSGEPADPAIAWVWPTGAGRPAVVRGFAPPTEPWHAGHRGVDLLSAPGEAILAAGAGLVTYAGPIAGIGVVVVSHGEVRTTYQPVRAAVTVGDRVQPGQELGPLDLAGSHCLPAACLHWGALRGDSYLDPLALVSAGGRIRLAPLGPSALSAARGQVPDTHHLAGNGVARAAAAGALAGFRTGH